MQKMQDRFTTCFKTWGTGPFILGVGAKLFAAKAARTDQDDWGASGTATYLGSGTEAFLGIEKANFKQRGTGLNIAL